MRPGTPVTYRGPAANFPQGVGRVVDSVRVPEIPFLSVRVAFPPLGHWWAPEGLWKRTVPRKPRVPLTVRAARVVRVGRVVLTVVVTRIV